jgi:hypothetical protein
MTLLDTELANLSTVELGRIAVMQKENQTHGAPYGTIATATLDVLHVRALLDAKADARATAQFADLSTADLNELASAGATLPTTWLAGRRARLLMAELHGRALVDETGRETLRAVDHADATDPGWRERALAELVFERDE